MIPWAPSLPPGWGARRAKFLFQRMRRPARDDEGVVTAFRDGQVTLRENRRTEGFTFAEKEIGYQGVRRGELVVHSMDAFAGAIGVSDSDGKCSPVYSVCLPQEGVDSRYYAYVLRHMALSGYIASLAKGIRERSTAFGFGELAEQVLPLPPPELQRAIARFLDRKTAAVDALIEKKERLVALLADKRASIIDRAVTKGLRPEGPVRDSGVPWIGELPAHWTIHQLRRVVARFIDYRGRTPEKAEEGVPLITAGAIKDGEIDHSRAPEWVTPEVHAWLSERGLPERGDLLFTSEAPLGEVALVEDPNIACAQRVILFRVDRRRMRPAYLRLHFLSAMGRAEVASRASGSTAEGIRSDRLKMSLVPTPPLEEQDSICAWVEAEIAPLKPVRQRLVDSIQKLIEYRQALISRAITGQLDVAKEV